MKRQVKTEIQKEIEDMLELNECGCTTYPSSCDTMKTVLRCKITVKSGSMKKMEKSNANSFYTQKEQTVADNLTQG